MDEYSTVTVVSTMGVVLSAVFGATSHLTKFCTMGAISDVMFMGDWNRFRSWMLAIAVAILGSQALHRCSTTDLADSIYLSINLGRAGAIIGGLMFGFGMTLGGGCGNKTLVRFGAGNLKSLMVAVSLRGLTGLARVELEE